MNIIIYLPVRACAENRAIAPLMYMYIINIYVKLYMEFRIPFGSVIISCTVVKHNECRILS